MKVSVILFIAHLSNYDQTSRQAVKCDTTLKRVPLCVSQIIESLTACTDFQTFTSARINFEF